MVLVKRHAMARAKALQEVTAKSLKGEISVNVAKEAGIFTDELSSYGWLHRQFAGHETGHRRTARR